MNLIQAEEEFWSAYHRIKDHGCSADLTVSHVIDGMCQELNTGKPRSSRQFQPITLKRVEPQFLDLVA